MLLLWATGLSCSSVFDTRNQHTRRFDAKEIWTQAKNVCQYKQASNVRRNTGKMNSALMMKTTLLWFRVIRLFSLLFASFVIRFAYIRAKEKLPRVVTHTENCLNFHGSYVKKRWRKNLLGTIMKSHSFLHSKTESEIFLVRFVDFSWNFFFYYISIFFLTIAGFLSTLHPTENPIPPMHKEPAMHDPASEPQSLPVLSTKKVHCRRHESGWWVLNLFQLKILERSPSSSTRPNRTFSKTSSFPLNLSTYTPIV